MPDFRAHDNHQSCGDATLRDLDDRSLLAAHVAGDRRAFGVMVRRHEGLLLRIAFSIVRDRGTAEDVVQAAFLSVFQAAPRFDHRASVKNWMCRITRNAAIDARRRRLARPSTTWSETEAERVADPVDVAAVADARAMVDDVLWELPEVWRQIVVMIDLLDLSFDQVADILAIPVGTVKSRRHRALRLLNERLAR